MAEAVRVGVLCGTRRADVEVPAALPVAALPDLLEDLLGPAAAGRRLATLAGRPLDPERPLEEQVATGALLVLTTGDEGQPLPRVHDDPAQALAEAVRGEPAWGGAARAVTARLLVVPAVGVAALAVLRAPGPGPGGPDPAPGVFGVAGVAWVAAAAAVALLGLAAATARGRRPDAALPAAYAGCLLGAAAAARAAPVPAPGLPAWSTEVGTPVGAALLVGALAGAAAVGRRWPLLLPVAALGTVLVGVGGVAAVAGDVVPVLALAVTGAVVGSGLAAGPALALAGWSPAPLRGPWAEDDTTGATGATGATVVPDRGGDVPRASALVAGALGSGGLLLVPAAPVLAAAGGAPAALVTALGAHVVLRARRAASARLVLLDLVPGVVVLASVAGTLLVAQPRLAPWLLLVAVAAVVALLVQPPTGGARRRRLADLAGTATLVAVPPLLVATTGLPGLVAGLVRGLDGIGG